MICERRKIRLAGLSPNNLIIWLRTKSHATRLLARVFGIRLNQLQELLHTLGLDIGFHNHPKGLGLEFGRCHSCVGECRFVMVASNESVR